jgi:glyoxylase-like metal-dependent hydrolase (beta-lactamase superfamily II)
MPGDSYHFMVGKFICIAIKDGDHIYAPPIFPPPATMLFCNAPANQLAPALARHNIISKEWLAWPSPYICLLINTGKQLVLVDTGAGKLGAATGNLLNNLQNEGISPEEIDLVILTHAHPDHIGGITLDNGQLAFPNARYIMSKIEWDFWTSGEAEERLDEKTREVLLTVTRKNLPPIADIVELIEGDKVIMPGIRCISAPGHTPGHLALLISDEEEQLLHMVDTVLHPIHLEHPEWHSIFDINPDQVVNSRNSLLDIAVTLNPLVLAFHFPFPGLGHIVKEQGIFKWQPVSN